MSFKDLIHKTGRKKILTLILLAIIIGAVVSIYNLNWWNTIVSGVSIEKITPSLKHDGRYLTITVTASGNIEVDIADIYINQLKIATYTIDTRRLDPNESTNITILYYWQQ